MTAFVTSHPAARKAKSRSRRGLTLFGVLMSLGLAAAAVIGAVAVYNTASETQNKNQAQALLTTLVVGVQQIHQGASTYGPTATNIVPMLALRNAIPSNARIGTGSAATIQHPFGDAVTVTGDGGSAPGTGRFVVTFEGLEEGHCALLLDPFIGQARASGSLWQVKVATRTAVNPPLTAATVQTECDTITATADVALTFE